MPAVTLSRLVEECDRLRATPAAEMVDVADAVGSLNQSYYISGFHKSTGFLGLETHAFTRGSAFADVVDDCDNNQCDITCDVPVLEGPKH